MKTKSKPSAVSRGTTKVESTNPQKLRKRYQVRIKQRDPIAESEAAEIRPNKSPSIATKPFEQCLIEFLGASALPEVSAKYQALSGADRPVEKPLASDRALMKEIHRSLYRDLLNYLAEHPCEVGLQVTRLGVVEGNAAVISVMEARKPKALYERAKVDGFAGVRFCPVPQADPAGLGVAVDLVVVVFGQDARSKLATAAARSRGIARFERSTIEWFGPGDTGSIEMVLKSMTSPPFNGLPRGDPFADRQGAFGPGCGSGLRAMITLMCRAQLPVSKALVGFGGGKRMVTRALADIDDSLKLRCKIGPEIVHQNEIPHFFFAEMRRLGWDHISVPIVKLH